MITILTLTEVEKVNKEDERDEPKICRAASEPFFEKRASKISPPDGKRQTTARVSLKCEICLSCKANSMRLSIFLKHDLTKKYVRTKLKPKTQVKPDKCE